MVTPAERGLESPTVGRACTLVEAERDAAATQVEKSMDEEKSMEGGVYAWMVLCGTVGDMPNLRRPGRERGYNGGAVPRGRGSPESARPPATG